MKRVICVVLILMVLGAGTACAEMHNGDHDGTILSACRVDDISMFYTEPTLADEPVFTQNCVIHVKVIHTKADGSTTESVISPAVFSVKYKFQIYKRSGVLSGGEMLRGVWPLVDTLDYGPYDLGVSVQKINDPPNASVSVSGNNYTCSVSGGLLRVTYYPVIYIDANGVETHGEPIPQERAYYGVFTGSVE